MAIDNVTIMREEKDSIDCHSSHMYYALRLSFAFVGAGMAVWGALIPYIKTNLAVSEAGLGLLLLCVGLGALITMPFSGALASRFGCRKELTCCIPMIFISLLLVTLIDSPYICALILLICGASLGIADVVINIQAIFIEETCQKKLMSNLHGMFSLGAIFGALGMIALLSAGLSPTYTLTIFSLLIGGITFLYCSPYFLPYGSKEESKSSFVIPKGIVFFIGIICFLLYMNEGSVLDWSALFLTVEIGIDPAQAALAYAVFATATALCRLVGDRLVLGLGVKKVIFFGACIASLGHGIVLMGDTAWLSLLGFALVGLGSANMIPQFFALSSKQNIMPVHMAIAAISMLGFLGVLIGPALMGFVAEISSLPYIFGLMALLLLLVGVFALYLFKTAFKEN